MEQERRQHRRLSIRLPLECYPVEAGRARAFRTLCDNISTGGLYFEVDDIEGVVVPKVDEVIHVELTVPPGDGYFPYQGCVSSTAQVVRREELPAGGQRGEGSNRRVGVAARFREPLQLSF